MARSTIEMPLDVRPLHLTRDHCYQRAKLVRNFAKGVASDLLRQDLLDIAAEYERCADAMAANSAAGNEIVHVDPSVGASTALSRDSTPSSLP
jgi:hypothetical protein